ncbi:MAG: hypothetical protein IK997_06400 [Bacilli bacterium]|nr:hypothetical protein [Bacilli bacterium]
MEKVKNVSISNISRESIYKIYRKKVLEQQRSFDSKTKSKIITLKYKTR